MNATFTPDLMEMDWLVGLNRQYFFAARHFGADFGFDFCHHFWVVLDEFFYSISTLTQFGGFVAIPTTAFLDDVGIYCDV